MKKCLFIGLPGGRKGLAIGAPSSPLVSNTVMYALDDKLRALAVSISGDSAYTRYADDIAFSTNLAGGCQRFYESLQRILNTEESPKLRINEDKTVFCSRGTRRVITGLFLTPGGEVSIGRKNKRYIRKLLFDLTQDALSDEERVYLSGYLAFVRDVEPDLCNRLALKYGAESVAAALRGGGSAETQRD
jgi:hypothetical protein